MEVVSNQVASMILQQDKTTLKDRTIRVKWERKGEILRDVSPVWFFTLVSQKYADRKIFSYSLNLNIFNPVEDQI